MTLKTKQNIIRDLEADLPRGAPFDLSTLAQFGVSPQLAAYYVDSGWLVRLAQGVYAYPNDDFNVFRVLEFLAKRAPGLHIGGRSALSMHGIWHNLRFRDRWSLWSDRRYVLPGWFISRFPARLRYAHLFKDLDLERAAKSVKPREDFPQNIAISKPTRAILEMFYDVGVKESPEEARNIFELMPPPPSDIMGPLLQACTSVKANRMFLNWAEETRLVDVDFLRENYSINTGGNKRWVRCLRNSDTLILRPYAQ